MNSGSPLVSISVVSHGQLALVAELLHDIDSKCRSTSIELILTLNLEETLPFPLEPFSFPLTVIRNVTPIGFAANHNQAFAKISGEFFCVMNPDIRLNCDPFQVLLSCLKIPSIGVAAPVVLSGTGELEDSARRFPTPLIILRKVFRSNKSRDYVICDKPVFPDWVGGMFMLFHEKTFKQVGGFDERYFLYYEDVDLCARLRLLGYEVAVCPEARVIHDAQRSSHTSFRYLRLHLSSMIRFFLSTVFWRVQYRKWLKFIKMFL